MSCLHYPVVRGRQYYQRVVCGAREEAYAWCRSHEDTPRGQDQGSARVQVRATKAPKKKGAPRHVVQHMLFTCCLMVGTGVGKCMNQGAYAGSSSLMRTEVYLHTMAYHGTPPHRRAGVSDTNRGTVRCNACTRLHGCAHVPRQGKDGVAVHPDFGRRRGRGCHGDLRGKSFLAIHRRLFGPPILRRHDSNRYPAHGARRVATTE